MRSQISFPVRVASAFAAVAISAMLVWAHAADEEVLGAHDLVVTQAATHIAAANR
jgi:hypothetical protein